MTYQSRLLGDDDVLDLQVLPETGVYFTVRWRVRDNLFPHGRQWREEAHLTAGEVASTVLLVADGFATDYEAQGLGEPF